MTDEKPLFIPLKSEFYEAFERGEKTDELRLYGARWNEKTCRIGRAVTLSKGYGKQNRMSRQVKRFQKIDAHKLPESQRKSVLKIYGTLDKLIARIGMTDD